MQVSSSSHPAWDLNRPTPPHRTAMPGPSAAFPPHASIDVQTDHHPQHFQDWQSMPPPPQNWYSDSQLPEFYELPPQPPSTNQADTPSIHTCQGTNTPPRPGKRPSSPMSALESDSKRQKIGHDGHPLSSSNSYSISDGSEKKENQLMISLLNGMEEEVTCPICFDILACAHITNPCGHSVCGECGWDWNDKKVKEGHDPKCPICQTTLTIKMALIPNFAADHFVSRWIKGRTDNGDNEWRTGGSKLVEFLKRKERWKSAVAEREAQAHTSTRPTRGRSGSGSNRRRSMIMPTAGAIGIGDLLASIANRQRSVTRQSSTAARPLVAEAPLYTQPAMPHSSSSSSSGARYNHHHPHPSAPYPGHDQPRSYPPQPRDTRSHLAHYHAAMMRNLGHDDRRSTQAPGGAGQPPDFTPPDATGVTGSGWPLRGHWPLHSYERPVMHTGQPLPPLPEVMAAPHHDPGRVNSNNNSNAHPTTIGSHDEGDVLEMQPGMVNVLFGAVPPRVQDSPPPQGSQSGPSYATGHSHRNGPPAIYAPPSFGPGQHQQQQSYQHLHHPHHYHHHHPGHGQQVGAIPSASHQQHQQLYQQQYPRAQQQQQQTVMPAAVGGPMSSDGRDRGAPWRSTVMNPTVAAPSASTSVPRVGVDTIDRENVHPDPIGLGAVSHLQLDRPAIADGRPPHGFWGA